MPYELPPIDEISDLSDASKVESLNQLFEPCKTLSSFILNNVFSKTQKYSSYKHFIESIRLELLKFLKESELESSWTGKPINPQISKIIAAHPRLGSPKPNSAPIKLSEHSSAEQRSLQSGSKEENEKLLQLNELYESTFPGLRYVAFVNGRSRPVIMENMIERINRNDIRLERVDAFNAMCDIALDRAKKLGAKL